MPAALLVDDEPNLLDHLQSKLADVWPELNIIATARNGREALALVRDEHPDIVFLDIHMPGLSGLQVAAQLPEDIAVVFVTAFDQYAVEAFETAAVDYLLKPVNAERLATAVERLKSRTAPAPRDELMNLIAELGQGRSPHLQWLRAGQGDAVQLVPVADVVYFRSEQKYTSVFTRDAEYLIRTSIKDLIGQLDPEAFWQIHRGIIVRVAEITRATRDLRGRYTLSLRSRGEKLRSSQSYGHLFKQM